MGRPASDLDDYPDWQQRLESQKESGLTMDVLLPSRGHLNSSFYRWLNRLREGIPKSVAEEESARQQKRVVAPAVPRDRLPSLAQSFGRLRPW
jgi:hypothetical protein